MELVNAIISERMKLKHSSILWLSILIMSVSPMLNIIIYFGRNSSLLELGRNVVNMGIIFIYPCLYGVIITYLFNREYQEDMMKTLLTVPVSKKTIILSKMVLLILWAVFLAIWSAALTVIAGAVIHISEITVQSIGLVFAINLKTAPIYVLCMLPITVLAIASKMGYILSLGVCVTITVGNFLINGGAFLACIYPWTIVSRFTGANMIDNYSYPAWVSLTAILVVATVSLIVAFRIFKKQNN
jgi:bacitracin transport system permease protein